MANETLDLARFCTELRFRDLPQPVVEKAKDSVLDLLGVAIAGHQMESSRIVTRLVRSMGGTGESSIIGEGVKVPMANAALANGAMAHALELDDTHRWTYLHAGASIIPPALAVAERRRLSGRQFLTSVVAGYEVAIRLALAVNPSHRGRGFHTTGTVGAVSAAAVAAKAMGLDAETAANALGIGGTQAAGLFEFLADGSMTKRLHPGRSAQSGVYAALLAEAGFTGPKTVLEGELGFCRALSDTPDVSWLNRGLGSDFKILEMGIKPYASCRYCHTSIDAAQEVLAESGPLTPDQIAEVVDVASPHNAQQTGDREPRTFMGAQMSTPYSVALVLTGRGAGFAQYLAGLQDEAVLETARKVRMVAEPSFGETSRRVELTVKLVDGRSFSSAIDLPLGEPERPITKEALRQKFMGLAATAISTERAERIAKLVETIPAMDNLQELIALLAEPAR